MAVMDIRDSQFVVKELAPGVSQETRKHAMTSSIRTFLKRRLFVLNLRIELLLIRLSAHLSGCAPAPPLDSPDMQVIPNLLEDGSISGVHLPSDRGITIPMDSMVDEPPACGMKPDCGRDAQPCSAEMNCPDGSPRDGAQNCGMSPDVGVDCTDSNCVPMNMCENDQDCPDMHRCEDAESGKRCILFETPPTPSRTGSVSMRSFGL